MLPPWLMKMLPGTTGAGNHIPDRSRKRTDLQVETLEDRTVPTVQLSIADPQIIVEGETTELIFTVTRTGETDVPIAVDFTTKNGSAVAGSDFEAISGTLELDSGETEAIITVTINDDSIEELDEFFTVELSNPRPQSVSFDTPVDFDTGSGFPAVAVSDFNGDGRPDLAVTRSYYGSFGQLTVLLNDTASGSSAPSFNASTFFPSIAPEAIAVADFDGDGRPDIALAGPYSSDIELLLNQTANGGSSAEFSTSPTSPLVLGGTINLQTADINGDGRPDLIALDYAFGDAVVFLNQTVAPGVVSFSAGQSFFISETAFTLAVGDINGDGRPDIVSDYGDEVTADTIILLNQTGQGASTASFGPPQEVPTIALVEQIVLSDINGDGLSDLIALSPNNSQLSARINQTPIAGTTVAFGAPEIINLNGFIPLDARPGDFNNDGKIDLAVFFLTGEVSVLLNDTDVGAATADFLSEEAFGPVGGFLLAGALADINTDGRLDAIAVTDGPGGEGGEGPRGPQGPGPSSGAFVLLNNSAIVTLTNSTSIALILDDDAPEFTPTVTFTNNNQQSGGVLVLPILNQEFTAVVASFTTNFEAFAEDFQAIINWGDGTFTNGIVLETTTGFDVIGTHTYTVETTFLVDVTITNDIFEIEAQTVPSAAVVLTFGQGGNVQNVGFQRTLPGATSAAATTTGVTAALSHLTNNPNNVLTLFVARYANNPEDATVEANDFYDVRVTGVDDNAILSVTFEFGEIDPDQAQLLFFNPAVRAFVPVQVTNPANLRVDLLRKTITVVFDGTSTPKVSALTGTVFTVAVSQPANTNGSFSPAVAIAADRSQSGSQGYSRRQVSFRSRSQLAISLSSSQDSSAERKLKSLKRRATEEEAPAENLDPAVMVQAIQSLFETTTETLIRIGQQWLDSGLFQLPSLLEGVAPPSAQDLLEAVPTGSLPRSQDLDDHFIDLAATSEPDALSSAPEKAPIWAGAILGMALLPAKEPKRKQSKLRR